MKTKVYTLHYKEREKVSKIVENAALILKNGGVVAFPSEVCYCLGVDSTNDSAVEKLLSLNVLLAPALNLIVADMRMAKEHFEIQKEVEEVIYKFTPGPLTVIAKLLEASKISKKLICNENAIGFRVSSSEIARMLSNELNAPLTAAVIAQEHAIYNVNELKQHLDGKIDAIIETGNLQPAIPSTIVDLKTGDEPILIREGPIPFDELKRELAKAKEVKLQA